MLLMPRVNEEDIHWLDLKPIVVIETKIVEMHMGA
jgi:hypothetical protein